MAIPDWQRTCTYRLIHANDEVAMPGAEYVAIDTETTGLNVDHLDLVGVSMSHSHGEAVYIPVAHKTFEHNSDARLLVERLTALYNAGTKLVFYNAGFDLSVLQKYGFPEIHPDDWGVRVFDAQVMLYHMYLHLYQGKNNSPNYIGSLKKASENLLGCKMITFHECLGMTKKEFNKSNKTFADVPVDENLLAYACADADITLRLFNLIREKYVITSLTRLDYKLIPVVRDMQRVGQVVDQAKLLSIEQETRARMNAAKERVTTLFNQTNKIAGLTLNLNSSKQLGAFLFDTMGLPVIIKTPKGAPAVSSEALKRLSWHPAGRKAQVLRDLLEYKDQETYLNKIVCKIKSGVDPATSRVFASYNTSSLVTGRLSTTGDGHFLKKFNFQGIPKREDEGDGLDLSIRNAFLAPEGYVWASFDLSNIELRLVAAFSRDPALVKAFQENQDLHTLTCERVFGISPSHEKFTFYRKVAKVLNFGSAYAFSGKGAIRSKLIESTQREWSKQESENLFLELYKSYPGWAKYKVECCKFARLNGYATSYFGRKRDLTPLYAVSRRDGCAGDRAACNHPIQATCADLIRAAMVRVGACIKSLPPGEVHLVSSIHDELNFNVRRSDNTKEILRNIKIVMEYTPKEWPVAVVTKCAVGKSWGLASEVEL